MEETDHVLEKLNRILDRIDRVCKDAGRNRNEVRLLMATKTVTPERIREALAQGQTLIAENKIQEVIEKHEALKDIPHESHFIGHLQTNKVKDILKYGISCVHSIDRLKLAQKLQNRLTLEDKEINVLIQVNTSAEESKFGTAPEDALALIRKVSEMDRIHIKGLMTIGLFSTDIDKVRPCFQMLYKIREEAAALRLPGVEMKELSMGMSGDFETAIQEGATIIRVGTAIFGKRQYPDSYYWNEGK